MRWAVVRPGRALRRGHHSRGCRLEPPLRVRGGDRQQDSGGRARAASDAHCPAGRLHGRGRLLLAPDAPLPGDLRRRRRNPARCRAAQCPRRRLRRLHPSVGPGRLGQRGSRDPESVLCRGARRGRRGPSRRGGSRRWGALERGFARGARERGAVVPDGPGRRLRGRGAPGRLSNQRDRRLRKVLELQLRCAGQGRRRGCRRQCRRGRLGRVDCLIIWGILRAGVAGVASIH
mmetsp:Transcript_5812/g.14878  ORF Transcript_5812/g.14878 Transcript_5812/m.14878 type:complete len:232 (+) Transcript_5812:472-1167(+)